MLLVEADPTGGSAVLAGYLRAESAPTNSLIDLALAQRHGQLSEAIAESTVRMPGPPGSAVSLLPGTRAHGQARSLLPLWQTLAAELKALEATGQDVIVDAGRLGLAGSPEPLIYAADLALLVTRTDLVSLSAARSWAETPANRVRRSRRDVVVGLAAGGGGGALLRPGRPEGPADPGDRLACLGPRGRRRVRQGRQGPAQIRLLPPRPQPRRGADLDPVRGGQPTASQLAAQIVGGTA